MGQLKLCVDLTHGSDVLLKGDHGAGNEWQYKSDGISSEEA